MTERTHLPMVPEPVLRRFSVYHPFDTRFRACARLLQSLWRDRLGDQRMIPEPTMVGANVSGAPAGRMLEAHALDRGVAQLRAEASHHLGRQCQIELHRPEQVQGHRQRREKVGPQPPLIDQRTGLPIGCLAASQPRNIGGQEVPALVGDLGADLRTELAVLAGLVGVAAGRKTQSVSRSVGRRV